MRLLVKSIKELKIYCSLNPDCTKRSFASKWYYRGIAEKLLLCIIVRASSSSSNMDKLIELLRTMMIDCVLVTWNRAHITRFEESSGLLKDFKLSVEQCYSFLWWFLIKKRTETSTDIDKFSHHLISARQNFFIEYFAVNWSCFRISEISSWEKKFFILAQICLRAQKKAQKLPRNKLHHIALRTEQRKKVWHVWSEQKVSFLQILSLFSIKKKENVPLSFRSLKIRLEHNMNRSIFDIPGLPGASTAWAAATWLR